MPDGVFLEPFLDEHLAAAGAFRAVLPDVERLGERLVACLASGHKIIICGNGGSAADAQHLAGELVGRYRTERRPLAAIALAGDPSVVTCIANDFAFGDVFARQVTALADRGDVTIGFTTSGRSANVIAALEAARARGAVAVAITGADPADAGVVADVVLAVPATGTPRVQELHTLVVHLLSEIVDRWAAGD